VIINRRFMVPLLLQPLWRKATRNEAGRSDAMERKGARGMNGRSSGLRQARRCMVAIGTTVAEHRMTRAATILLLLGLALVGAGCSKCASPFGTPGVCHDEQPAVR
jgi:hypothetical protein